MTFKIERLNDQGKGICYVDNVITFVDGVLPSEEVELKVISKHKNYQEAELIKIIKKSPDRIKSFCKYSDICGGCNLSNLKYNDTLEFKKNKLKNILKKFAKKVCDIEIVESINNTEYRNKIKLHIKDSKIGYYEENSNSIIEIDECLVAKKSINEFIKVLPKYNIKNGEVIIRCNRNDELLIIFNTLDKIELIETNLKIAGIILNDKVIYNDNYFVNEINDMYFKVSYNSFFQINDYMCMKIFEIIKKNILKNKVVLDLYCGVGTLGLSVARESKKIYGIEVIDNAIIDAVKNAEINNIKNANFMCGEVSKCIDKIKDDIDVIIIDPPRNGLDKYSRDVIKNINPEEIIYVSCDPITLARDIKDFDNYKIQKVYCLDMFPYTHHVECVTLLCRKTL